MKSNRVSWQDSLSVRISYRRHRFRSVRRRTGTVTTGVLRRERRPRRRENAVTCRLQALPILSLQRASYTCAGHTAMTIERTKSRTVTVDDRVSAARTGERAHGHHVFRAYFNNSFVKQFRLRQNRKSDGFPGGGEPAAQRLLEDNQFWLLTPGFSNPRARDKGRSSNSSSARGDFNGRSPLPRPPLYSGTGTRRRPS